MSYLKTEAFHFCFLFKYNDFTKLTKYSEQNYFIIFLTGREKKKNAGAKFLLKAELNMVLWDQITWLYSKILYRRAG